MTEELEIGARVSTVLGREALVLRFIGRGGQGSVYEVAYAGSRKALKWYHDGAIRRPREFIRNLRRNIENGAPTDEFLWPLDLTDSYGGQFGYVMDLRPQGYVEVDAFLTNQAAFPSYRRCVDACLNIVHAFRILHDEGYAYSDINSKNFFINPDTGKVLICDNDNVVPDSYDSGVWGTPGYMAPEVVRGGKPNALSDLHSMAVLLFLLLFKAHPLEGMSMEGTILTEQERLRIYGIEPLFVFDPNDSRNHLFVETHASTIRMWEEMPSYMRALFLRAFGQKALLNPNQRPIDAEWTSALARFRSEIQACPCGRSEVIVSDGKPVKCENCGRMMYSSLLVDTGKCLLPAKFDTRIYACLARVCSVSQALNIEAWVVRSRDEDSILGLLNTGDYPWNAYINDENMPDDGELLSNPIHSREFAVFPSEVIELREGLRIEGKGLALNIRRSGVNIA